MKHLLFFIIFTINYLFAFTQTFSSNEFVTTRNLKHKKIKQISDTSFLITHSISQDIIPETSVSCNKNGVHFENSYYRVFDLSSSIFNINGDLTVQQVQVGIGYSKGGIDTIQNVKLVLYQMSTYNGTIQLDSLNQKGDTLNFQVSDNESGTIRTLQVQPPVSIPKGRVLVVEVLVPDGQQDSNVFFIGANDLPQTDKTFIKAKHCNVNEIVDVADIGYADMHLLINVIGAYNAADPQILSFNINGQLKDTEILNNPNSISLILPADTSLISLTPNIVVPAGFYISPTSGEEVNFSNGAVEYTVTNEFNKISESWLVTVNKAPADIISFSVPNQVGSSVINSLNHTINAVLPSGSDLTDISPTIEVYGGFSINPSSQTSQDFSNGVVTYTVSHDKIELSQDWLISITTESKFNKLSEINIYPNPTRENINIKSNKFIKAEIFNLSGVKLINSNKSNINIEALKKGYYFIKIYSDNTITIKRFIVE